MESFSYVDLFATKGLEYLLVIGFLVAFLLYWRWLNKPAKSEVETTSQPVETMNAWFHFAKNLFYHQGHSWVMPEDKNIAKIGIDDFAYKLMGQPHSIKLPEVGSTIEQGDKNLKFLIDSKSIAMLSPVDGEVIAVNEKVLENPSLIGEDPYNNGWLLKAKVDNMKPNLNNLLQGNLVVSWMEQTVKALRGRMTGELGIMLQDGGTPVAGFARELSPDNWDEIAAEFFLSE